MIKLLAESHLLIASMKNVNLSRIRVSLIMALWG